MASMPLMIRLMMTCWSCTRSPSTAGSPDARSSRSATRWPSTSRCTSRIASLMTSLMSSRVISGVAFLARSRMRRITLLARSASLITRLDGMARLLDLRRLAVQPPQAGLTIGDDAGKRLVDLVRDRGGQLAERRHARDVRKLRLRLLQRLPGPLPLRDVGVGLQDRGGLPALVPLQRPPARNRRVRPVALACMSSPSQRPVLKTAAVIASRAARKARLGDRARLCRRSCALQPYRTSAPRFQ